VTPDPFVESVLAGAPERWARFGKLFSLQGDVGDLVNRVLDEEGDKMQVRHGEDRLLSGFVGPILGKAMKTFQGVERLCLLGFGEDAAVLLRSNVNLLVNLAYIVTDADAKERMREFVADAWTRHAKFMKGAFNVEVDAANSPLPGEDLEALAERWQKVNIADRAKRLPPHHYKTGYKFYSAIEHSDPVAVFGYVSDWDEAGLRVESGPSDSHVEVILMHSAEVMAAVLHYVCRYWGIDRPDIFAEVTKLFKAFASENAGSSPIAS
jgi:hypothetical protein